MISLLEKNYLNKKNILIIITCSIFWFSLGTKLQINETTFKNIFNLNLINNLRFFSPYFLLIYFVFNKKNLFNNFSPLNLIIYLIFFSFLLGNANLYLLNDQYIQKFESDENLINSGYLPNKLKDLFMCFSFILVFIILNKCKKKELKIIIITNYFFLILASSLNIFYAYKDFFLNNNTYLYYTNFLVSGEILGVASIRSLGLARNLLLIAVPLIIYFCLFKKKTNNFFIFLIILFISSNIFQLQSRTSVYFFCVFILVIIIHQFFKKNYKNLLTILAITILIPNFLSYNIPQIKAKLLKVKIHERSSRIFTLNPNHLKNYNHTENLQKTHSNKNSNKKKTKDGLQKTKDETPMINTESSDSSKLINTYSSGRLNLWIDAIYLIIAEKKISTLLFGFGPSSDRYFIKENLSNAIIFSFFSGGLFGLIGVILLYFLGLKEILVYFFSKKETGDILYGLTCSTYIIYLFLRSVVENSFVVYGTDNIILISSLLFLRIINVKRETNYY